VNAILFHIGPAQLLKPLKRFIVNKLVHEKKYGFLKCVGLLSGTFFDCEYLTK